MDVVAFLFYQEGGVGENKIAFVNTCCFCCLGKSERKAAVFFLYAFIAFSLLPCKLAGVYVTWFALASQLTGLA